MAGNNQPTTGIYKFNGRLFDPSKSTSTSTFDDWMYSNPNSYQKYLSKGGEYLGTGSKYDSNISLSKFGSKNDTYNPNNVGNGMFKDTYESTYRAGYESNGKPVPTFEIHNTGSDDYYSDSYVDPISATTVNSSTALTSGTSAGIPLTPTNTSAPWSGTLNGVTGNTSSVPPLSTMSLDDQLKQAQIKYIDELVKPAPTFLGMDRANVGLSMQGLGLASQLYSEFGSDGNRKLRKEQIGALRDDRDRANEEQQAIRDYRNSYK